MTTLHCYEELRLVELQQVTGFTIMSNNYSNFGAIRQLGYLVEDIDSAVDVWMQQLQAGPWTVIKNVPLLCTYMEQESSPTVDIALAYRGDMQIELIQQTNDAPSPYRKYFQQKQFGLHHTAYLSHNMDATVEQAKALGHQVVCDINMPDGARYVYTQIEALGNDVFVEFLDATPNMLKMFEYGIPAAAKWRPGLTPEKDVTVIDLSQRI